MLKEKSLNSCKCIATGSKEVRSSVIFIFIPTKDAQAREQGSTSKRELTEAAKLLCCSF